MPALNQRLFLKNSTPRMHSNSPLLSHFYAKTLQINWVDDSRPK